MSEPRSQLESQPDVTRAMAALDDLEQQPLSEHVTRLEAAHAALRRALDAPAS